MSEIQNPIPMPSAKKPQPRVLEETLLVEITDPAIGTDAFGTARQIVLSRDAYEQQKKDVGMKLVKIIKPAGVTMQQHLEAQKAQEEAPKAAPKKAAPSTSKAKPKSKAKAPAAAAPPPEPVVSEDPDYDPIKAQIEAEGLAQLEAEAAKTE